MPKRVMRCGLRIVPRRGALRAAAQPAARQKIGGAVENRRRGRYIYRAGTYLPRRHISTAPRVTRIVDQVLAQA